MKLNKTHKSIILIFLVIYTLISIDILVAREFAALGFFEVTILITPYFLLSEYPLDILKFFTPFLISNYTYDHFREIAWKLNGNINWNLLPDIEEHIFNGKTSTEIWQKKFSWVMTTPLKNILTISYLIHFISPLAMFIYFWRTNKKALKRFVIAISILNTAAFFTFYIFPAAPPWLASEHGVIAPIHQYLINEVQRVFPLGDINLWHNFNGNPVAPFPSLHAAYPFLIYLFSKRYIPIISKYVLLLFFTVTFTIVFYGEHYLIDVFAGCLYSYAAYKASNEVANFI